MFQKFWFFLKYINATKVVKYQKTIKNNIIFKKNQDIYKKMLFTNKFPT